MITMCTATAIAVVFGFLLVIRNVSNRFLEVALFLMYNSCRLLVGTVVFGVFVILGTIYTVHHVSLVGLAVFRYFLQRTMMILELLDTALYYAITFLRGLLFVVRYFIFHLWGDVFQLPLDRLPFEHNRTRPNTVVVEEEEDS